VWVAFWEIDAARKVAVGMSAAIYQPIGHEGIHHYQQAHGHRLQPWERRAVLRMDSVRLAFLNTPEDQREKRDEPSAAQPVSPALLQSLFGNSKK
jgi:hypothetical protein